MADLLQGVREGATAGSGDGPEDFKMPSTEELLAAIEQMSGLTEDMKKELIDGVLAGQHGGGQAGIPGFDGLADGAVPAAAAAQSVSLQIVWILSLFSIVFLVLVFFGYKLYKSLVDRERRREEKKRQKLQKKKR